MEFQNLIEKRRSVRKYAERNTVTKDEILSMIKAAQEAPSWKNSQTGRYYCIMDEKNVEQFRRECLPEMNAGKCENAVLLVSTFVHNRAGFQKDGTADNELGNGWGCYDLGLQNENLILKAEELGYGTLIMGIRDVDKIRVFCSVPETETVVAVIAVGVPGEEPGRPKRKDTEAISRSTTISYNLTSLDQINKYLYPLVEDVCIQLRRKNKYASLVGVMLKDNNFKTYSHQRKLKNPTSNTDEIYKTACELVKELYNDDRIRLVGIALGKFSSSSNYQMSLFEDIKKIDNNNELDKVVDKLKNIYGNNIIKKASEIKKD